MQSEEQDHTNAFGPFVLTVGWKLPDVRLDVTAVFFLFIFCV